MSGGTAALSAPVTDGRILRAARTRRLVVDAFLDLAQEGKLRRTAQQAADRSGVAARLITTTMLAVLASPVGLARTPI